MLKRISCFLILAWFFLGTAGAQGLNLDQSIDQALNFSPKVKAARNNLDASQARVYQSGATLGPKLTLQGVYGKDYTQPITVNIPGVGPMTITPDETSIIANYSLGLTQPIFTGNKLNLAYSMAKSSYNITSEELRRVKNDVTYNTTSAYFQVLKAEKMLDLVNQQILNTEQYLKQVQVFYDSGLATKAELLRVKAQLANFQTLAINANKNLALARLSFNSILGRKLNTEVMVDEISTLDLNPPQVAAADLIALAYSQNPDWRAFLQTKNITETGVGLAWGSFFPDISFASALGSKMIDYPTHGQVYLSNWQTVIEGSWNIFDSFSNLRKVDEAQSKVKVVNEQEQILRDQLELQITSAIEELKAASQQISASQITADLSSQSLEFAQASYASQTGTYLAVMDAQTLMYQSETNLWASKYDYQIAKAKINYVTGTEVFKL